MAASKRKSSRKKYGDAATKSVERAMHKRKKGTLKSGAGRHPKVKSREQAIAIGLSEAREKGAKVPRKRTGAKKSSAKKSARKSSPKRTSARKSSKRSSAAKKGARKRAASR